jgi:hypothetical protein
MMTAAGFDAPHCESFDYLAKRETEGTKDTVECARIASSI